MSEAAHKVELTRHINRLHFLFPHEFSFYPKTWMLPEEFGEVSAYMSKAKKPPTLIVKPDGGSQGDGIFLMQNIQILYCLIHNQLNISFLFYYNLYTIVRSF